MVVIRPYISLGFQICQYIAIILMLGVVKFDV